MTIQPEEALREFRSQTAHNYLHFYTSMPRSPAALTTMYALPNIRGHKLCKVTNMDHTASCKENLYIIIVCVFLVAFRLLQMVTSVLGTSTYSTYHQYSLGHLPMISSLHPSGLMLT